MLSDDTQELAVWAECRTVFCDRKEGLFREKPRKSKPWICLTLTAWMNTGGGGVSQRGTGNTIIRFNSGGREMEKWSMGERPRRSVWRNRLVEAAETRQAGSEAISWPTSTSSQTGSFISRGANQWVLLSSTTTCFSSAPSFYSNNKEQAKHTHTHSNSPAPAERKEGQAERKNRFFFK